MPAVGVRDAGARLRRRWLAVPALLAIIASGFAHAQVTTTGHIRVTVTDQDGLAVPGATVTAAADDAATTRVAVTDTRGLAELAALNPSARYVVTVELQGFQTIRNDRLVAENRNAADLEFSRFDTAVTGAGRLLPTRRGSSAATGGWNAATRWSHWTAWTSSAQSRTRRISSTRATAAACRVATTIT